MNRKRKEDEQEPLLTAVARKLGQAAGTLANMTHLLTPDAVAKTESPFSSKAAPATTQPVPASSEKVQTSANPGRKRKTKPRAVAHQRSRSANTRPHKTSMTKKKASSRKKQ